MAFVLREQGELDKFIKKRVTGIDPPPPRSMGILSEEGRSFIESDHWVGVWL